MRRRAVVGTPGLVWGFCVTPADVADCKGARAAVREAHSAYRGLIAFARVLFDLTVEVVTRREGAVGFEVLPRRRVVERPFG